MRGSNKSLAASGTPFSNRLHAAIRPVVEQLESRQLLSASVSGTVYNDPTGAGTGLNGYGASGLGGVTVYVDSNNNGKLDAGEASTVSASDGTYTLAGVAAGAQIIRQNVPSGLRQNYPTQVAGNHVTVGSTNLTGVNFDDTNTAYLTGTVYADTNGNGKQDSGEAGLSGVIVAIISNSAGSDANDEGEIDVTATATTDSNGMYTLVGVAPGNYTITDVAAAGTSAGNQLIPVTAAEVVSGINLGNTTLAPITSATLAGTVIGTAGSYNNSGNTIAKVFDGNLGNFFDGPTADGDYAGLDLGTGKVITQISYAPRVGYASRMVGGIFQGSDSADFSGPVTDLYTVTASPASGVFTTVSVSSVSPFRYVRYLAPDGSYGDVAEVQFTGYAPATGARQSSDGTLAVYGTNNADSINLTFNSQSLNNAVITDVNGSFDVFANVTQIVVAALGGNDQVDYYYTVNGQETAIDIPTTVLGGDGNDGISIFYPLTPVFVDAGAGNDSVFVFGDSIDYVTINGGDGNDSIGGEGANQVYIDAYGDEGDDSIDFDLDAFGLMNGGAGNDTLDISYPNPFSDTVVGGDGNDTFDGTGGGGTSVLRLDGQDDSSLGNGPITLGADIENIDIDGGGSPVEIYGTSAANAITVSDIEDATIMGGDGNDTITADGGGDVLIDCGNGNNTVDTTTIEATVNGGSGNDTIYASEFFESTINGGAGDDTAYVNLNVDTVTNVEHVIDSQGGGAVGGTVSGLAGKSEVIYLDANNNSTLDNGELSTDTQSDGSYSFTNVPAGAYVVRQVLPTGYTQTSPTMNYGAHVTVTNGGTFTGNNFTDTAPATGGSISGSVINGQAGETIYLDANNNSVLDNGDLSTTTSSTGTYRFSNVPIGAYVVRQVLPSGYTQTTPAGNYGDHVTVTAGSTSTGNNFTDTAPAAGGSISGAVTGGQAGETIYLDFNNDSKLDNGELSTTTSSTGTYSFSNVPAGAYIVRQVLPTGYSQTSPGGGLGIHLTVAKGSNFTNEDFADQSTTVTRLAGTTIGTPGSYNNDGNTIAKATDGILTNFYDGAAGDGNWVGYDLGSSESISQVAFTPRDGYASRMVGGEIQISTTADFSSGVTTLYTISATPPTGVLTTVVFSSPVTARYVRYLSPDASHGDIAEFDVFG